MCVLLVVFRGIIIIIIIIIVNYEGVTGEWKEERIIITSRGSSSSIGCDDFNTNNIKVRTIIIKTLNNKFQFFISMLT